MGYCTSFTMYYADGTKKDSFVSSCYGALGDMNLIHEDHGRLEKVGVHVPSRKGIHTISHMWNNFLTKEQTIDFAKKWSYQLGVPLIDTKEHDSIQLGGEKHPSLELIYDVSKRYNKGIVRFLTFNRVFYETTWNRVAYCLSKILDDPRCKNMNVFHMLSISFNCNLAHEGHSLTRNLQDRLEEGMSYCKLVETPNAYIKRFYNHVNNNALIQNYTVSDKLFNIKDVRKFDYSSTPRDKIILVYDIDANYDKMIGFYFKEFKNILK